MAAAAANRVLLLVLGDIGRSPRMLNHAERLAQHGFEVDLLGYGGSTPSKRVLQSERIRIVELRQYCVRASGVPFRLAKAVLQLLQLLFILLFGVQRPDFILVQNPPAIPTLIVTVIVSVLRGSRLIIDWHNFAFSILALRLGPKHPLVKLAYWYERVLGRCSSGNLCVTAAMQAELARVWSVSASLLYDRPPPHFRPLSVDQRHSFFTRVLQEPDFRPLKRWSTELKKGSTLFTHRTESGEFEMRPDRPFIVVSSTSYTADEDFQVLLDAIVRYDKEADSRSLPRFVVIITGKGPLKKHYENIIASLHLEHILVLQVWLSAEDYPLLLGSADVGVSLHTSSSGLDLPMKVVDMFGAGLPVCAIDFSCLSELVEDERNGLVFRSSSELTEKLVRMFVAPSFLDGLRHGVTSFQRVRWAQAWDDAALPLFSPSSSSSHLLLISVLVAASSLAAFALFLLLP